MSQTNQMYRWTSTGILRGIVCLILWPAMCILAQVSTANVAGVVEDSTGARIPNAAVKLINNQTGTENDSKTDHYGVFVLPGVIPGAYTLQIERDGFATAQFTGLVLNIGETKRILVRMQLGPVTQTVNIDASGLTPNSIDASVSTVVDRQFVANIPLNGRSFQDLISMTPGVSSQSPQAIGAGYRVQGDFSVNGQLPDTNSYTIDGVSADIGVGLLMGHQKIASSGSAAGSTALGTTQSLVSIDDLQEFRVLTSSYSVEYGRTSGGQFTLLTRSGTDKFHGSLYDYLRNNAADAADWFTKFNSANRPLPYQQNDFGGSVGGPLRIPHVYDGRNRTFFFLSFEGLRVTEPTAPLVEYTPTSQIAHAAPAPVQLLLSAFPPPYSGNNVNPPPASTGLGPFVSISLSEPGHVESTSIRVDHSFSPKLSAFFRYSDTPSWGQSIILSAESTNRLDTQTSTMGIASQITPSKTNELRIGYGASTSQLGTILTDNLGDLSYAPPDLNAVIGIPASFSSAASDVFIHSAGAGDSEVNTDEAFGSIHQWNLRDTFAVQTGHHLLQLGIDQRHLSSTVKPPALSVEADFFNPQALLANRASDIAITKNLPATPVFNQFAAFLQDEWQVSKSFTVSSGLRWEVNPPPHGEHGADAYTVRGNITAPAALTLAPRGTPLWNTGWFNLAPRFGVAWLADGRSGHELVVRAGGGVFFDTANRAAAPAFSALGFSATEQIVNAPVPINASQLNFSVAPSPPYTTSLVFNFPRHLQLPYAIQWNAAIEQSLGKSQTLTASYIGASGRSLLREQRRDFNDQNPEFGEIVWFPPNLTSSYQALQLKFQSSVTHQIQALASYTWSHSLDYGSPDPAWPLTRADSDFDLRQNFEAAISWNEPKLSGTGFRELILENWGADGRLTARTAFPMTALGNIFSDPATGNRYFSGVDLIPNKPLYVYGSQYPGGRALNGGPYASNPAFALPDVTSAGDAPRNKARGFGDNQVNIALQREVPLGHDVGLQIRGEAYNLFNHPDLGYIDPSLSDALFGQATLMLNQSFGPTGSLYEPGGPRSVQISLRLHF
ncbi:MAG: carboxypeptidase regulatory-like domain-containing protein [Acidobacteriaceae bacterium]